jgi:urea carboxylase
MIFKVLHPGLETSVQDYPGRIGYLALGIPPSGPMDSLSFRLGNLIVGNDEGAAGLEIQFIGPKIEFLGDMVLAISGADNKPRINDHPIPLWTAIRVETGDVLSFDFAKEGSRSYITIAGGIDVPPMMGSKSTFAKAQIGGYQGRPLKKDDVVRINKPVISLDKLVRRQLKSEFIPRFSNQWEVEVMLGPHNDWLTPSDTEQFLTAPWRVSSKSNRIGYRLEGPEFQFSDAARCKPLENGRHPSNVMDYGSPPGSVSLCGQTLIIILLDGPSLEGYISPFVVINSSLWKVGQSRPGDFLRFRLVTLEEARKLQEELTKKIHGDVVQEIL